MAGNFEGYMSSVFHFVDPSTHGKISLYLSQYAKHPYGLRILFSTYQLTLKSTVKIVEGNLPDDADALLKNYGDWLPKEFGGKAELDGSELIRSILAEKEYLEQLRKTCDVNVLV